MYDIASLEYLNDEASNYGREKPAETEVETARKKEHRALAHLQVCTRKRMDLEERLTGKPGPLLYRELASGNNDDEFDDTRERQLNEAMETIRGLYWAKVRTIADELIDDVYKSIITTDDDLSESIDQVTDQCPWVQSTFYSTMTFLVTENLDTAEERVGEMFGGEEIRWTNVAFWCLREDIAGLVYRANIQPDDVECCSECEELWSKHEFLDGKPICPDEEEDQD